MAVRYPAVPLYTWSLSGSHASLSVEARDTGNDGKLLRCTTGSLTFEVVIPFADRASTENAVSVIACSLAEESSRRGHN
ncbi:MAG: hypothetical protein MZV63_68705 [Marinilabiliales bacterium]|nr:hypothetical protein [Marinilabiliales bacterium]